MKSLSISRAFAIVIFAFASVASSQEFPKQLVRIVIPFPAGGQSVDGMTRALGQGLSEIWKQPVVIENKPGASTAIAGDYVARAKADGYTLYVTTDASITVNPFLFPNSKINPLKDFAPITQLIDLVQMVVVNKSIPANSLQELVVFAKEKKGELNYCSYGVGSQPNLLFESLRVKTGVEIAHIPYQGVAPCINATVSGQTQMTTGSFALTSGHILAGNLKPIVIPGKKRLKELPNVQTLREAGFAEIDPNAWVGMFAPAGTPKPVIEKIQRDVVRVFAKPEFQKLLQALGSEQVTSTPDVFEKFIAEDYSNKKKLINSAGIEPVN